MERYLNSSRLIKIFNILLLENTLKRIVLVALHGLLGVNLEPGRRILYTNRRSIGILR